ncbi:hypothetical protein CERSUDRAFT_34819, partial [Gelatoporia subvermispora B]
PLTIVCGLRTVVTGLTSLLHAREDIGWIGIPDTEPFKIAAYHLRRRSAPSFLLWAPKTSAPPHLLEATTLATVGAARPLPYQIPTDIPAAFSISGARLASITQAVAYRGIVAMTLPKQRRSTLINLDIARYQVKKRTGKTPQDADLWMGCRDAAFGRPVADFLWKCLHGALKCGDYWLRITNFEHRADCGSCAVPETLEHILFECPNSGQRTVWALANSVWRSRHGED